MDRSELIAAFQDTMSKSMSPILKNGTELAAQSSRVYLEGFRSRKQTKQHKAEIIVEENTTFAAARKHLARGKTAVLNFANPETPGGGVQNGAMAQEECLCRSSNLYTCLTANSFPDYYQYHRELHNHFYSDRLIYTEGVTVFKDDSDIPNMLEEKDWFQVDIITCAAPYIAKRRYTNRTALKGLFKGRIQNIFEVAIEHDIETLILGAFGCGAFKNPPDVVAKAFKEVIEENSYKERFTKIVFAIKSTVNSNPFEPCPNIMAFEREFYVLSAEANKLRFSDNWALAQSIGSVKMPSGKVLKGGEQFNPYEKWQAKNKYFGKQFSILGDSISTLEGYNPRGYNLFYTGETCDRTGVHDMMDTWWGKVIDYVGGELLVNNSWSGSRVTKLPDRETLFPSGCSDERTGGLHIGSVMPDVIIVYLGTNDWAQGVNSGNFDTFLLNDKYEERFDAAYESMLHKLCTNYPNAEIWCCTLNSTYMPSKPAFVFPHSYAGTHIEKFNEVIRTVCQKQKNTKLIDLYSSNVPYASIDGSHPTAEGMGTLASLVLHGLCDREGVSFLECDYSEHEFITAEEYTGGTKFACRKCGLVDHHNMLQPEAFDQLYAGSTVNGRKIQKKDPDIIDLNPNCTAMLYSADDGIRLFSESRGEDIRICKTEFLAGRSKDCELHMSSNVIARMQATFMFDGNSWLLRDNQSTNGTWLNDTKLIPGKKYVLHPDDVIDFAHTERFVFFKTNTQQSNGNQAEKAVVFLEAGMKRFHDSDHKDETAFKLIISALVNAPLYLPVSIDLGAMFGDIDPTKLKPGDVIQSQKDVPVKILTINVQDTEYIPMFTSTEQVNKEQPVSAMRMSPQTYLPKIIGMDKDVVINPFGGMPFIVNRKMMKELLFPLVLQNSVKVEVNDKDDLLGQKIEDKYELIQLLGRGGIVWTYIGRDITGKMWTVKVCDKTSPNFSDYQRNAIMQEAHMMMRFNHPAIPKVNDLIENENRIIVVREYIEGSTLHELLTKNGSFSEHDVRYFGQCLADALLYMHRFDPPYIYRDMKPMNAMVTPSRAVKLIDFGIAMEYRPGATSDIDYLGTKGYAAPEQYGGKGAIDSRTDIYGLGMTLYHLLTGIAPNEPPYETPPIRQVKPEITKGMEYIVHKCIAPNPDERYQNCEELLLDLNNIQNLPPKKGLFSSLFGKKDKKPVNPAPPINQTVARLYAGMDKDAREKMFHL